MNPFRDQEKFMKACDQTTDGWNVEQFNLYVNLIKEEFDELKVAIDDANSTDVVDALTDILVVTIGAAHSMGCDIEGAWKEVMKTNFAKIGDDGKIRKREDGKVLKPIGWVPPDLEPFVKKNV
jgi:predicted HAD superfamily Cof-like phosphohydrolase